MDGVQCDVDGRHPAIIASDGLGSLGRVAEVPGHGTLPSGLGHANLEDVITPNQQTQRRFHLANIVWVAHAARSAAASSAAARSRRPWVVWSNTSAR